MGLFRGPELVTEGLFSAFDAAAPRSYTSGSSTWNDLSGHNNGSDVRSSNEFSTDFNGGIAVVAQTGGVKMPGWDDRTVWTTGFVYNRTGNPTSYGRLLGSGGGTGGIDTGEVALFSTDGNLRFNGPRDSWTDSGVTIALNSTTYIVLYMNRSNGEVKIFINGEEEYSVTQSGTDEGDFEYYSLGTRSDFNTEFTPGIYYCCHSYGRELATHEVKQNYNALKSRFNI